MQDAWKENLDDGPPLLSLGSQPWKSSSASDPSSSASSAVVDNASAEVKASSPSSENSDNSGTTLKEHDYIGLAEVSSASASLHRQEKASLSLEDDADLNLGLGLGLGPAKKAEPVDDGEKTLNFQQENANPVVETAKPFAWSTKEGPNPNQKFQTAAPQVFPFTTGRGAPASAQAAMAKNGMKRGYTEAMTDPSRFNMAPPPAAPPMVVKNAEAEMKAVPKHQQPAFIPSWAAPKPAPWLEQPASHSFAAAPAPAATANKPSPVVVPATPKPADCPPPPAYKPHEASEAAHENANDEAPPAKGRVVGWPPIRSYRKNTLAKPSEMFVKVNMDGVTVGRKVDLNAHNSYDSLLLALEEMFQPSNTTGTPQAAAGSVSDGKHFRLLSGSDYVLTYEDKDGDWMLVGDVPWSMFTNTVRRLRIQRGTEATGLAPRATEKAK